MEGCIKSSATEVKWESKSGVARIKAEFVITDHERILSLECVSEKDKEILQDHEEKKEKDCDDSQPHKRQRLSKSEMKKILARGQNKARPPPFKCERETALCNSLVDVAEGESVPSCQLKMCTSIHDVCKYLEIKPADIGPTCYVYSLRGRCPRGTSCRFGSEHLTGDGKNIVNSAVWEKFQKDCTSSTVCALSKDLQYTLRRRLYDFSKSEKILQQFTKSKVDRQDEKGDCNKHLISACFKEIPAESRVKIEADTISRVKIEADTISRVKIEADTISRMKIEADTISRVKIEADDSLVSNTVVKKSGEVLNPGGCVNDEEIIKIRPEEKKLISWQDKLYLSPLTTVGNLPFRRVCKEFGVDVTCGEMGMATSLLQGTSQEWALTKRHSSEDLFGVQLCGNNPYVMTRCAQLLQERASIDFVDINLGCPIDLVYNQGAGSGLLRRQSVLKSVIKSMTAVLHLPLTVKLRTGVYTDKNIAHTLVPQFSDWGASLITVHGRSREQRYTRSADWAYIEQCAQVARPTPLFGNGDVLSFEDYDRARRDFPSVAGIMIGRGALIKPWIFTEIKERRHWDISSAERLDILKKYANYGMENWGSDTMGVEKTRRFLLEWLSFLHRYIPVGVLECVPQRMNERPPYYEGRDELETLMASSNCADWIKISEMLLGPVPENFRFLPKHKANSWK